MSTLKALADWRAGLAFLLAVGITIWLSPLPAGSIVVVFSVSAAIVYLVAALLQLLNRKLRKIED